MGITITETSAPDEKSMSIWFLYLIRFGKNNLYTGISTDVKRRFVEHNSGGPKAAKSVRGKGPMELAFSIEIGGRSEASRLESRVKKLSRPEKEKLVAGELDIFKLD